MYEGVIMYELFLSASTALFNLNLVGLATIAAIKEGSRLTFNPISEFELLEYMSDVDIYDPKKEYELLNQLD